MSVDEPLPDPRRSVPRTDAVLADPENAPVRMLVGGIGLGARVATRAIAQGLKVDAAFSLGFPLHPSGKPGHQDVDSLRYRPITPPN